MSLKRDFSVHAGEKRLDWMLQTALEVAQAMMHLHSESIIHGDLKARNILLKSSGSHGRGFVAKVADFGAR
jgi:serine/threonine protein kinase